MAKPAADKLESQRLDKWLWAARFYKTRSLSVEAIHGGKVHVNGQRAKPSRSIHVGDEVRITKPPYEFTIDILGLQMQRRPAVEAQTLYQEHDESRRKREKLREQIKNEPLGAPEQKGRPDKRDRRRIIRFTKGI